MKFKAYLTDGGISLLEKRLLPAIEKVGKSCHVYLSREHAMFLHNLLQNDGVQCIAQIEVESLFSDYQVSSNNSDLIAFSVDISLFLRALRSASSISAASSASSRRLQLKLVKKLPPNSTSPSPFLTFETKSPFSAVVQDVPISKPLSRAQLSDLQSALDAAQDLPRTLVGVQGTELSRILSLAERMKHLGDSVDVLVAGGGDLHLKVSNSLLSIGAEFKSLAVVGEGQGGGGAVQVALRHFVKTLQCHLAKPDYAFYGVGAHSGSLTVVFQFFLPGTTQTNKSISLHCRLPVLDPGMYHVLHCSERYRDAIVSLALYLREKVMLLVNSLWSVIKFCIVFEKMMSTLFI